MPGTRGRTSASREPAVCAGNSRSIGTVVGFTSCTATSTGGRPPRAPARGRYAATRRVGAGTVQVTDGARVLDSLFRKAHHQPHAATVEERELRPAVEEVPDPELVPVERLGALHVLHVVGDLLDGGDHSILHDGCGH